MDKKSSQKRREYTESSSSSEAENASASKAAKPAFSWTKYERQREYLMKNGQIYTYVSKLLI